MSFEIIKDELGREIEHIFDGSPKDPRSWKCGHNGNTVIYRTFGENPESEFSWVSTLDEKGNYLTRTYANDLKHSKSWADERDENDNQASRKFSDDVDNEKSWGFVKPFMAILENPELEVEK